MMGLSVIAVLLPFFPALGQKNRPPDKQAQGGRQCSGGGKKKTDGDKKPAHQTTAGGVFRQQVSGAFSQGATCPARIVMDCDTVCKNFMLRFGWKPAPALAGSQVVTRHFFCAFWPRFC